MTTKNDFFTYVDEHLGVKPDYPFADNIAIFRHPKKRKWFAAVIDNLDRSKLNPNDTGPCTIVNLKCHPILAGTYRLQPGIFPGYHMNKEHWLTLILDGTIPPETVWELLEISFELTKS